MHLKPHSALILTIASAVCLAAVCCCSGKTPLTKKLADGTYKVTIVETSDIHGAYFDSLYNGTTNRTSLSNVASYLKQVRSEEKNVVLIDNGDNLQGDNAAFFYNYEVPDRKHVFTAMSEYLGYDAIVVGNHDIEPGHAVYDRLAASSSIPYLAANAVHSSGEDAGKPYFKPYTVVVRDGIRIAVIGMTNANIKSWLGSTIWEGIDFQVISDVAQDWVDLVIEKEKPHLVVLSVHSGTAGLDGGEGPDKESEALYLARTLKGVDVVCAGHDHRHYVSLVDNDGRRVAIINPETRCSYVGRCDVTFTVKSGEVVSKEFAPSVEDMRLFLPDADFNAEFRPMFEDVKEFANKEIGYLAGDISFNDCTSGPSAYISLVHAVQLATTGADISITAPLSVRGTVKAGKVTYQNLSELYRYENTLYLVVMTGQQVKDFLEYSYDLWINNSAPSFDFDSAEGIDYTVVRSAPYGRRVRIASLTGGKPFDPEKEYTVALNSYRASGGGGHLLKGAHLDPADLRILEKYPDIKSLIGEYIAENKQIVPKASSNWSFRE